MIDVSAIDRVTKADPFRRDSTLIYAERGRNEEPKDTGGGTERHAWWGLITDNP